MSGLYLSAPGNLGQVLDQGFKLFKACFSKVWWIGLLAAVGGQLPQLFELIRLGATGMAAIGLLQQSVNTLIAVLISMTFMSLMIKRVDAIGRGIGAPSLGEALSRTPALLGALILYTVAIMGGAILLVVPALILMVSLTLSFYLVVADNVGPLEALRRSHKLIWRGYWWRTTAVMMVAFIVYSVPALLVGGIVGFVIAMLAMGSNQTDPGMMTLVTVLSGFSSSFVTGLLMPLLTSILLVHMRDLQLRRSGADLAARAEIA